MEQRSKQQASELKQLPKDTRKNVCLKAGIEQDAELTAKKQLAMKAKMRLTWTQCRAFKRFAKSVGIKYESERREREERSKTYHAITATKMTVWVKNDKAPDSINGMITQEMYYFTAAMRMSIHFPSEILHIPLSGFQFTGLRIPLPRCIFHLLSSLSADSFCSKINKIVICISIKLNLQC